MGSIALITVEPAVQRFACESAWKWGVMINSKSSELEQIVQGNIPPNAYFSEEHVQMFSGACPRHITKEMLRAMRTPHFHALSHANRWTASSTVIRTIVLLMKLNVRSRIFLHEVRVIRTETQLPMDEGPYCFCLTEVKCSRLSCDPLGVLWNEIEF